GAVAERPRQGLCSAWRPGRSGDAGARGGCARGEDRPAEHAGRHAGRPRRGPHARRAGRGGRRGARAGRGGGRAQGQPPVPPPRPGTGAGLSYDVLVLGGGAAGCVLAARLSENPDRRVCLVEAGPDYGHLAEGRWPADILDPRWLALESHLWERDDEDDRSQLRARIIGGCSAHNACVVLTGKPADSGWGRPGTPTPFPYHLPTTQPSLPPP